jgi:hypothetical protein
MKDGVRLKKQMAKCYGSRQLRHGLSAGRFRESHRRFDRTLRAIVGQLRDDFRKSESINSVSRKMDTNVLCLGVCAYSGLAEGWPVKCC